MGPHSIGECNENGKQLLDFCTSNNMLASNTWFQHKLLHRATWFQNSDHSQPGQLIDMFSSTNAFALVSWTLMCTDLLFMSMTSNLCIFCVFFKIKVKRRQSRYLRYRTTNLSSYKASYQSVLAETFDKSDQTSTLTLYGKLSNSPSKKPVNPHLLHPKSVIMTGSLMKSTTSPGRNKMLGFI